MTRFRLLACAVVLSLSAVQAAHAQSIVVGSGTTQPTTITLGFPGDSLTVEAGGAITTTNVTAVEMNAADQSANNGGSITTSGDTAGGIEAFGDSTVIINSGTITTDGDGAFAVASSGDGAAISNSGTITTTGDFGFAISVLGDGADVSNSGTITTTGVVAPGIVSVFSDGVRISNSGTITTSGNDTSGIRSEGGNAAIANNGTITTSGSDASGIESNGGNTAITNSGAITTSGSDAFGILSNDDGAVITNRGTVMTSGSDAYGIESDGDGAVITNSGTIWTGGNSASGIFATLGVGAVISNAGTITTSGDSASGIESRGDAAAITNSGLLGTIGSSSYGIESDNDGAVISNTGTITTSGSYANGIESRGDHTVITNSSVIMIGGSPASGIESQGDGVVITNNGTITTGGGFSGGIASLGDGAVIRNNGVITTSGAYGITTLGDGALIRNSGLIRTTGPAVGIITFNSNATIINSGTIISTGDDSIVGTAPNTTLKLLPGSVLVGDLEFDFPESATLDIARGLSTALHFDTCGCSGGIPATIDTHGAPLAVSGSWVYTADVTALIAQGQMLGDLTDAIYGAVDGGRAAGGAKTTPPLGYAPENAIARDLSIFRDGKPEPVREAWVKGFGGTRDQDAHGLDMGSEQKLAGFVSGMDLFATQDWVGGAFVGGSWAKADVENSQTLEAQSVFGGVYASRDVGTARLDLAALVGWSTYDSKRQVADNTDPDGIDTAKADYNGWFVSPRVALTQPFQLGPQRVEVRVAARYAGLFLDSFEEHGAEGALQIDKREVHLLLGRASLALPTDYVHPDGAWTRLTPTLGIEGRTQFGDDDVDGALAGIDIDFSTGKEKALGGFAELRLEHQTAHGLNLFAAAEGLVEDDGSTRFSGKGGLRMQF